MRHRKEAARERGKASSELPFHHQLSELLGREAAPRAEPLCRWRSCHPQGRQLVGSQGWNSLSSAASL